MKRKWCRIQEWLQSAAVQGSHVSWLTHGQGILRTAWFFSLTSVLLDLFPHAGLVALTSTLSWETDFLLIFVICLPSFPAPVCEFQHFPCFSRASFQFAAHVSTHRSRSDGFTTVIPKFFHRVYSIHQFPFSCYIFHQRSGIITLSFFLRPPGAQRPLLPPLTS